MRIVLSVFSLLFSLNSFATETSSNVYCAISSNVKGMEIVEKEFNLGATSTFVGQVNGYEVTAAKDSAGIFMIVAKDGAGMQHVVSGDLKSQGIALNIYQAGPISGENARISLSVECAANE